MPVEVKPLFRPDVLRPRLHAFRLPEAAESCRPDLAKWAAMLTSAQADQLKEQDILPDFLSDVFGGLLGYTRPQDDPQRYTLSREKHVEVSGKFADAVLGEFTPGRERFVVALEGKGPKDPLDRPFAGRKMSAVDQGYRYAINLPCDWVIVTSMRQTRLYCKGADQLTYERFHTTDLAKNEKLLKKFVFLLGAERVVPPDGRCHLDELRRASENVERELTKGFYLQYAGLREDAFERLCRANPDESQHAVLSATQKLLDRVLFCGFCEDRGLLPPDTLRKAFEAKNPYSPQPVWENFRGLFRSIDAGNESLSIPAYNGGLFAEDELLDGRLVVPDVVCGHFRELGEYDYRPPQLAADAAEEDDAASAAGSAGLVDVDILGHIFEQSITDLEQLRSELDGLVASEGKEKHQSRRKKEGAFYTPAFVTRHIVEQTLGGVLADRFEELRRRHAGEASGTAVKVLDDPAVYDMAALNNPQREALVHFWEDWQDELARVRVLDPACGSGAFLIEAFDQLHATYERSNDRLEELRGHRTLFDLDRRILQHNLYGVDLNEEAIQICRLSLWIKTAQRGKRLTSLDHTIRVGNSVVDDPAVHPLAFDWQAAFPEVHETGGFDVVVGNPPYIRQEWLRPYKDYWQRRFQSFHGTADIFTYFYELGVELLRPGGRLGFITSGSWVRSNFGGPLRGYLTSQAGLESLIDFGEFQPFEGAEMIRPTIAILSKRPPGGKLRLFKWLTKGRPPENLSEVIEKAATLTTDHLGQETWELEPDEVIALRRKMMDVGEPLGSYSNGIYRGVVTGLNDVFAINSTLRDELIAQDGRSTDLIKPFIQGTNMRPWYIEDTAAYLIFTRRGTDIEQYPAIKAYLTDFRARLEPKPTDWDGSKKWSGRKAGSYEWYEIQDTVDYWEVFEQPKIVWPDISKLPRFSMDLKRRYLGNTGFVVPGEDYYLLGVLGSWATWFLISKTAQPLRLRGNRWQYRLFTQYMERLPVPDAPAGDRKAIADLAAKANACAAERYAVQKRFRHRLTTSFGEQSEGKLNQKAERWWEHSLNDLGSALKSSFKLSGNPFKKPRVADEWEPYLKEKQAEVDRLSRDLAETEDELNDRVNRLFNLTPEEIELLRREVEH